MNELSVKQIEIIPELSEAGQRAVDALEACVRSSGLSLEEADEIVSAFAELIGDEADETVIEPFLADALDEVKAKGGQPKPLAELLPDESNPIREVEVKYKNRIAPPVNLPIATGEKKDIKPEKINGDGSVMKELIKNREQQKVKLEFLKKVFPEEPELSEEEEEKREQIEWGERLIEKMGWKIDTPQQRKRLIKEIDGLLKNI